jgi:hypothetical protein
MNSVPNSKGGGARHIQKLLKTADVLQLIKNKRT